MQTYKILFKPICCCNRISNDIFSNKTLFRAFYNPKNQLNDRIFIQNPNKKSITTSKLFENKNESLKDEHQSNKNSTKIEKIQSEIEEDAVKKEQSFIQNSNSLVNSMPKILQPYLKLMRIDKPIGTLVVFWPGVWSILGSASYLNQSIPDLNLLAIFTIGAFTMRSAGCIINDIWDYKFDRNVERTKTRPIATGQLNIPSTIGLLGVNLSASLYLLLQLNLTTQILGACALLPVALYPTTKRFSNWPQFYLGLAINWGALMGWSAVMCNNSANAQNIFDFIPALILYAACINWTIFYDTIYANQDKLYDIKLGLKSTAIHFGKKQKLWLLGFSTLCTTNLCLFGYLTHQQPIFYGFMALVYAHFLKQILFLNTDSVNSCNREFRSNSTIGILVALGLLTSFVIKN